MRPSRQIVAVSIGVSLVLGNLAPSPAQERQEAVPVADPAQPAKLENPSDRALPEPAATTSTVPTSNQASPAKAETQKAATVQPIQAPTVAPTNTPTAPASKRNTPKVNPANVNPSRSGKTSSVPRKSTSGQSTASQATPARLNSLQTNPGKTNSVLPQAVPPATPVNLTDFKAQNSPSPRAIPVNPATGSPPIAPTPVISPTQPGSSAIPDFMPSAPIGSAKAGNAPEYLYPNPNPLSIPTRPEDVQLRGIQPITLQQAIELAKRNNRDLQVAVLQLARSRASLRQAEAALYPTLGAQANITRSASAGTDLRQQAISQAGSQGISTTPNQGTSTTTQQTTTTGAGTGTTQQGTTTLANTDQLTTGASTGQTLTNLDTTSTTFSTGLQLSYSIFTSGRRPAQIRAAQQQLRSDQLQVEITEQQLRLDVATAYYNLQQSDEGVRIQQSAVRNAQASLRDTQALERAGLGTRFDVLRAQVQLANARQNLTNAVATQQTRRRQLTQILAVPVYIDLAAADPVEIAGSWPLTLPQTIVLALKNRGELEQQLAQRELSEQQRRAALAALGPTVNLQLQYNLLDNLRDNVGFGKGYSLAANFAWNFFDGGAARAQANQQEANKTIAEVRFAQARENIQLQVETAFFNLESTFLNIGTNRQAVAQAREALRLARLRFQAGVGTQTDVINAENDFTLAQGNLVNAIIGYNLALASLQRSVTNLPVPTGSTTPTLPGPAPTLPPVQLTF